MDRICLLRIGCISDVWLLLACLLLIAVLALYSWRRRNVPGAKPLAIACLFGFLWMVGVLGQVLAEEVSTKIAWYQFQAVWQVPGATATAWFCLEFAGYGRRLTRRSLLLLAIPPLVALLMIITNDYHHLWWRRFTVGDPLRPIFGVGAWLLVGYGWALVFANMVVLIRLFFRSHQHRWPVVLIIAGQLACRTLFAMYLVNLNLLVTPYILILAIMIPITMYGIALFGFGIFDPLPRARRTAIEQMQEGMVVFDPSWKLLSMNPAAEKILGRTAAQLRGKTWQQIVSLQTNLEQQDIPIPVPSLKTEAYGPAEIFLGHDADIHCYEVDYSPLKDQHESVVGYLILLRDSTARRRAQAQRLKEEQMLAVMAERERLARELHDNLGQVFAFVSAQGQTARLFLARGEADAADAHLARLIEVAHEADTDIRESILSLRARLAQRGFLSALASYLDIYQQCHGIRTHMNGPSDPIDCAMDPSVEVQLLRIIQEALTNVRKHARARCVCIDFRPQDGHALVSIQDDGCGFDLCEVRNNSAGRLGLRIMQERAEEVGGRIELHSKPGQGTKVTIAVPLATGLYSLDSHQEDDHAYLIG